MKATLECLFIYIAGTCLVALLGAVLIWLGFELGFAFIVLAVWGAAMTAGTTIELFKKYKEL